jgi:hypothetical protein
MKRARVSGKSMGRVPCSWFLVGSRLVAALIIVKDRRQSCAGLGRPENSLGCSFEQSKKPLRNFYSAARRMSTKIRAIKNIIFGLAFKKMGRWQTGAEFRAAP